VGQINKKKLAWLMTNGAQALVAKDQNEVVAFCLTFLHDSSYTSKNYLYFK
jgi:predicted GNAT superfamily acetyltransferase